MVLLHQIIAGQENLLLHLGRNTDDTVMDSYFQLLIRQRQDLKTIPKGSCFQSLKPQREKNKSTSQLVKTLRCCSPDFCPASCCAWVRAGCSSDFGETRTPVVCVWTYKISTTGLMKEPRVRCGQQGSHHPVQRPARHAHAVGGQHLDGGCDYVPLPFVFWPHVLRE